MKSLHIDYIETVEAGPPLDADVHDSTPHTIETTFQLNGLSHGVRTVIPHYERTRWGTHRHTDTLVRYIGVQVRKVLDGT